MNVHSHNYYRRGLSDTWIAHNIIIQCHVYYTFTDQLYIIHVSYKIIQNRGCYSISFLEGPKHNFNLKAIILVTSDNMFVCAHVKRIKSHKNLIQIAHIYNRKKWLKRQIFEFLQYLVF